MKCCLVVQPAEGESNNAYRMFVDGLQSTLTSLLCDGKQCGRTAEVSKHIGFYDFAEIISGIFLVGSVKASLSALFFHHT